jgi:hypothetical protein
MAFTSAITEQYCQGNKLVSIGTFTSAGGSTGGDIDTGMSMCEKIVLTVGGSAAATNAPVVNETLPLAGNAITIVSDADETGYWRAEGY